MRRWAPPATAAATRSTCAGSDASSPRAVAAAHAVPFLHHHLADIHADGAGVVKDDPGDGVVGELAEETGAQAEPGAGVGDVKLAAAHVDFQGAGELDAPVTRRGEPDHAFAKGQQVVMALRSIAEGKGHSLYQG